VVALELDCASGTLSAFKNGVLLGVAASMPQIDPNGDKTFIWMVELDAGDHVTIAVRRRSLAL
jgi:hypothetical protein